MPVAVALAAAYRLVQEVVSVPEAIDVARELYEAVAAGDRDAIAARLAPDVRWRARARGPRWRRRRGGCVGSDDATASMLVIGCKLPTMHPREFQAEADRVLVGLWADTMEGRPTRWWTVLTVRDGRVVAIEDHARRREAARTLDSETVGDAST